MHSENLNQGKIRLVSFVSLILGFLDAFVIYTLSTYFSRVTGNDNVGIFYLIAYSGVLVSLFYLQPLIRAMGKARMLYLTLCITILASAFLASLEVSWASIAIILLFMIATNVTWTALDILLESYSRDSMSGRIRGLYLTIMNAGLIFAPFFSMNVLDQFGFSGIFFTVLIGYTCVFIIALIGFRNDNRVFQGRLKLRETFRKMIRTKDLMRIYHISFSMEFFYAMMIVYTPLFLRSIGFSYQEIGILFTIMLLPFVFLQYPLGVLADRRFGEKELLLGCIGIAGIATLWIGLVDSTSLLVWGVLLFMTRVGIAGIEVLRDSFFYKQIDGNDMDVIAFFRTARPIANIFGALISAIFLFFLPLQGIFIVVAAMLFLALKTTTVLTDTASEAERSLGVETTA